VVEEELRTMEKEINQILYEKVWPLELRTCVIRNEVRHKFKYSQFSFLKAFY